MAKKNELTENELSEEQKMQLSFHSFGEEVEEYMLHAFIKRLGKMGHKLHRILEEKAFVKANLDKFMRLTPREQELIALWATGFNNPQVAEKLTISRSTVEQHRKNIHKKLEIDNLAQLIKFAMAFDLV